MGWEVRNGRRYYYRKIRRGGRVVSEYVGTGDIAELVAQQDRIERQRRAQEIRQRQQERARFEAIDNELDSLQVTIGVLTRSTLEAEGFHYTGRRWRRKRGNNNK